MKRSSSAHAKEPAGKVKKAVKQAVNKLVKEVPAKVTKVAEDVNALSVAELDLIKKIDARLQDLYYLNDEEDYIGYC